MMKLCLTCKVQPVRPATPAGRKYYHCSECYNHKENNRYHGKRKDSVKARHQQNGSKGRDFVNSLKIDKPCNDCGNTFPPYCMDFAHKDQATKIKNVSQLVKGSQARILEEIAKCDLLCAVCHRIRTFEGGHHKNFKA